MNFTRKAVSEAVVQSGIRRGTLSVVRSSGHDYAYHLETPGCFVYTDIGSIPHLTPDDLQYINNLPHPVPLNMTLASVMDFADSVEKFGKPLGNFVGFPDAFVYLSLYDVLAPPKPGSNDRKGIGLWNKTGKLKITTEKFTELAAKLQPDLIQIMGDMDTELENCTSQRLNKSFESSLKWLDSCLETLKLTSAQTPVLATVGGGSDPWRRKHFCIEAANRKVDGFVVDGFGGNWVHNFKTWEKLRGIFGHHKNLMEDSFKQLPKDKPRFIHAPLPPQAVVELIQLGIDVFDTSYPSALADRGEALLKTTETEFDVLILSEQKYFDDLTPLSGSCGCYTCKNYSKAYVHHLIKCKEINARVLLMIHNLNEYLKFFKDIRLSIENGSFSSWL